MRVTIEHRETSKGLLFKKALFEVHCKVDFTDDELDIIKSRKLKDTIVMERGVPASHNPNAYTPEKMGRQDIFYLCLYDLMKKTDVYTLDSPLAAKQYEEQLKGQLVALRDYLKGNDETKQGATTFEL